MKVQVLEVKYKQSDLLGIIIPWSFFIAILSFGYYLDVSRPGCMIGVAFFVITMLLSIIASLTFYLKIENDIFYVRKRFGKKCKFPLSELKSIYCSNNYSLHAHADEKIILTFGEIHVTLISNMLGMQEFVNYILEKYENGEISKQILKKSDYEAFKKYQEEYIKKNEKNKKRS